MSKRWTVSRFSQLSLEGFNGSTLTSQNVETLGNFWSLFFGSGKKGDTEMFGSFSKNSLERITEKSFLLLTNAWEFRESSDPQPISYTQFFTTSQQQQLFFFLGRQSFSSTKKRKRSSLRIWCLAMVDHNKKKLNKRPRRSVVSRVRRCLLVEPKIQNPWIEFLRVFGPEKTAFLDDCFFFLRT